MTNHTTGDDTPSDDTMGHDNTTNLAQLTHNKVGNIIKQQANVIKTINKLNQAHTNYVKSRQDDTIIDMLNTIDANLVAKDETLPAVEENILACVETKTDNIVKELVDTKDAIIDSVEIKAVGAAIDARDDLIVELGCLKNTVLSELETKAVAAATAAKDDLIVELGDVGASVLAELETKADTVALSLVEAKDELIVELGSLKTTVLAEVETKAVAAATAAKDELMVEIILINSSLASLQSKQEDILTQLSVIIAGIAASKENN